MTRPTIERLLLAASLFLAPALAFGQSDYLEDVREAAAGTAVFVIIVAVIAVVFGILREKFRRDLFARFIDKGQEIPAALLPRPPSRERELRRGVWLTCLGLGVGVVLFMAGGPRVAAWSLILLFLAAGSFLNAMLFYRGDPGEPR